MVSQLESFCYAIVALFYPGVLPQPLGELVVVTPLLLYYPVKVTLVLWLDPFFENGGPLSHRPVLLMAPFVESFSYTLGILLNPVGSP